jgi:hypothetical protein
MSTNLSIAVVGSGKLAADPLHGGRQHLRKSGLAEHRSLHSNVASWPEGKVPRCPLSRRC